MRSLPFMQVDVFTDRRFAGNPLAVFPYGDGLTDEQMQAIAREMNLSETTFVSPAAGEGDARVRIFTPGTELPFAGHPSLGTACTLVRMGFLRRQTPVTTVVLELNVGPITVDVEIEGGEPVGAVMYQPAPEFGAEIDRAEAAAVLGLTEADLHPHWTPCVVSTGLPYALIALRDTDAVARSAYVLDLLPEFERRWAELYPFALTGVAAPFAEARCFAPFAGIPEDPATGSAAGPLAAYLARVGALEIGATAVIAQGRHCGRPSEISVSVTAEGDRLTGVRVGGRVVPVLAGELTM
jgi:trans-2,3-dihydro-3-hydroxyanthranilate isomerase